MNRNEYAKIKYVEILAFWKILRQIHRTPGEPITGVLKSVENDYALGGKIPVQKGLKICLATRSIEINSNSTATISDDGQTLVNPSSLSDPSSEELREIVRVLLNQNKMSWVVFCSEDSTAFRTAVPDNWEKILDNCGLFNLADPDIFKWWQALFFKYDQDKEARLKKIGDIGESLTYKLEIERVSKDGYDPSVKVNWAASIDDTLGFDILSINGTYHSNDRETPLYIEVKSSELKNLKFFRFHISRNEWDTALDNLEDYFFYCWVGVKSNGSFHSGPYIISAKDIAKLVPADQSTQSEWRMCRMTVDLTSYILYKWYKNNTRN